jgi:hypothetical protein
MPQEVLAISNSTPRVTVTPYKQNFTYDYVFDSSSSQRLIYDSCVQPLLEKFVEGKHRLMSSLSV